jgi:hypothetical protein
MGGMALGNALLPGIGGHVGGLLGGIAGKGIGGLFGKKRRNQGQMSFADSEAQSLYQQLGDPSFGMERMQRMAASQQPTLSDFLGMSVARGGSMAQGQEQFNAARQQGQSGAYGAMLDFEQSRIGAQQGLLGSIMQRQTAHDEMNMQNRMAKRQSGFSFLDNLLSLGGQAALDRYGSPRQPSRLSNDQAGALGGWATNRAVQGAKPTWKPLEDVHIDPRRV